MGTWGWWYMPITPVFGGKGWVVDTNDQSVNNLHKDRGLQTRDTVLEKPPNLKQWRRGGNRLPDDEQKFRGSG